MNRPKHVVRQGTREALKSPEHESTGAKAQSRASLSRSLSGAVCASQWPSEIPYSAYKFVDADGLNQLPQEDVQFLDMKSCLLLPRRPYLDDFMRHFFQYVHPGLPVIDEHDFWTIYHGRVGGERGKAGSTISLFLMQAILWASCTV